MIGVTRRPKPRGRVWPLGLLVTLIVAGCGTRVERDNAGRATTSAPEAAFSSADSAAGANVTSPSGASDVAIGGSALPAAGATGPTGGSVQPAGGPTTPSIAAGGGTVVGSRPSPAAPASGGAARDSGGGVSKPSPSGTPGTPGGGGTQTPSVATPKSPIVLASVGTLSGPIGATIAGVTKGAQVWVKHINQRGGLGGHEVRYLIFDDAGDPARHRAQVQEAIEVRQAIAFLANAEAITGSGSIEYITGKGVPVIGSDGAGAQFYASPMFFPQMSHYDSLHYAGVAGPAQIMIPKGKKKFGSLVCAEAQACSDADRVMAGAAKGVGFDHVYREKASLAQPDYTAQCLAARNSGAEILLVILDVNSVGRLAASCTRQSYRPTFSTVASIVTDRMRDDPNLEGLVAGTQTFPYFQTGTPATDEYQQAMKTLGGSLPNGVGPAQGWVAGKLLEAAGAKMAEPPSPAGILAGLWSIKDDNLGGLTHPLTFTQGQPAKPKACWFNITVKGGTWTSADGYKLNCKD